MQKLRPALAIEYPIETAVLRTLCAALAVLVFSYLYFVSASVLNVIAQREARTQADGLMTAIGTAERDYFALSNAVTPEAGVPLGLGPVSNSNIAYVYRPGVVGQAESPRNAI